MTFTPIFVVVRASTATAERCAGSPILTTIFNCIQLRHSMDEKWRVSRVELLEGGLLYGFVLYDQKARLWPQ